MQCLWYEFDLIVDALALHEEREWFQVVCASERELLLERLVAIWSEHDVHGLPLPWKERARLRHDLESLAFLGCCRDIRRGGVLPGACDFLLIFKSYLDCFPGLHAHLPEVEALCAHDELWDRQVGNELDLVLWAAFDVERQDVPLLSLP